MKMKLGFKQKITDGCFLNGILVKNIGIDKSQYYSNPYLGKYGYPIRLPDISLIDLNNDLAINLSRTEITNFNEESLVVEETYKYILARLLVRPISDTNIFDSNKFRDKRLAMSKNGFTMCSPSFIYHTKQQRVVLLYYKDDKRLTPISLSDKLFAILKKDSITQCEIDGYKLISNGSIESVCHNCWYKHSDEQERTKRFLSNSNRKYYDLGNNCFHIAVPRESKKEPPFNLKLSGNLSLIIEYLPQNPCYSTEKNIMLKVLCEYLPNDINGGLIPYDLDKRREFYPKAFLELEKYMRIDASKNFGKTNVGTFRSPP
ncbi:MAG: hypothetical protein LBH44_02010 [Treponema sp.]|jgi:hypothetical protein|nr:hypothetical protein [Treponema sp.]